MESDTWGRGQCHNSQQGCLQDVKSQDRDETESVNLQDRDVAFFSNSQDRDETETFNLQDRDEMRRSKKHLETASRPRRSKKRIETAVSQFKNTNWWSLSLHKLFFAGQIHYFLHDISATLMHCAHGHMTKVTRPRRYIFKTETRPRRWTLKTETRPRHSIFPNSRDRDETETFNLQDRDETFQKNVSRPRRSRPRLHPWFSTLSRISCIESATIKVLSEVLAWQLQVQVQVHKYFHSY